MTSLQTLPKVALRAMEPEDLDMLYSIENNMELWCVGTANVPYSRYVLHDYIASSSGDIYADRQVRFVIVDDSGNTVTVSPDSDGSYFDSNGVAYQNEGSGKWIDENGTTWSES